MCKLFKKQQVKSGECVITSEQQEAIAAKRNIIVALEELEASEVAITEEEVSEAVANALGKRFRYLKENMKHSITNCPNCGAPMHNGKCEYCGTEYKQ